MTRYEEIIKGISFIVIGLSLGWAINEAKWEPLIVFLGALSAYLGIKLKERKERPSLRFTEVDESEWLNMLIKYLEECQYAKIYLRYFRSPDCQEEERLNNKREEIRRLMDRFVHLMIEDYEEFLLIGFRKNTWNDNPEVWLVNKMLEIKPSLKESEAKSIVESHVRIIHREPEANSSTIYLLDNRYLFYNRVVGEIGQDRKKYYVADLSNSIIPYLIKNGFDKI